MKINNKNKQGEIKFVIGSICVSMKIEDSVIRKRLEGYYRNFITQKDPDITVYIERKKISGKNNLRAFRFQNRAWRLDIENGRILLYFPRGNKSSLAKFNTDLNEIYFYTQDPSGQLLLYLFPEILFSLILPQNNAIMLHACGVLGSKKAYLFVSPTAGGKSTIAKLALKQGLTLLNDERIILHKEKNFFEMYGNPWHGEVQECSSGYSYIKEAFFLKKSNINQIVPMSKIEALTEFIQNSLYLPINNDIIKKRFNICSALSEYLNCYWLRFKPDKSIWKFLDGFPK